MFQLFVSLGQFVVSVFLIFPLWFIAFTIDLALIDWTVCVRSDCVVLFR